MSIFNRTSTTAMVDKLAAKAAEKTTNSSNKEAVASTLISQAADLRSAAQVDAAHAEAIAKAVAILDEAGVNI